MPNQLERDTSATVVVVVACIAFPPLILAVLGLGLLWGVWRMGRAGLGALAGMCARAWARSRSGA